MKQKIIKALKNNRTDGLPFTETLNFILRGTKDENLRFSLGLIFSFSHFSQVKGSYILDEQEKSCRFLLSCLEEFPDTRVGKVSSYTFVDSNSVEDLYNNLKKSFFIETCIFYLVPLSEISLEIQLLIIRESIGKLKLEKAFQLLFLVLRRSDQKHILDKEGYFMLLAYYWLEENPSLFNQYGLHQYLFMEGITRWMVFRLTQILERLKKNSS